MKFQVSSLACPEVSKPRSARGWKLASQRSGNTVPPRDASSHVTDSQERRDVISIFCSGFTPSTHPIWYTEARRYNILEARTDARAGDDEGIMDKVIGLSSLFDLARLGKIKTRQDRHMRCHHVESLLVVDLMTLADLALSIGVDIC